MRTSKTHKETPPSSPTALCQRALVLADELAAIVDDLRDIRRHPASAVRPQQLRAVAEAVANLEAQRMPVPDELRRLKTALLVDHSPAQSPDETSDDQVAQTMDDLYGRLSILLTVIGEMLDPTAAQIRAATEDRPDENTSPH